jgi:hypothetical protein
MKSIDQSDSYSYYGYFPTSSKDPNPQNLPECYLTPQEKKVLTGEINEEKNQEKIFEVKKRKKNPLFNSTENESTEVSLNSGITSIKRKRNKEKRRRRDNSDNIRKKIKGGFFNGALIKRLNFILKQNRSKLYFVKFHQKFISNITRKSNKKFLNMTLLEIFEKKEVYSSNDLNFKHNLKVVQTKEIKENEELKEILNKKYCELFEEYINSKEFNIDEINRLEEKFDDSYIESYKNLARHFIEFFAN